MLIEPLILRSHQRLDQIGRELGIRHRYAVGLVGIVSADDLAVGRIDLRRRFVDRVLQVFYIRRIANHPKPNEEKEEEPNANQ